MNKNTADQTSNDDAHNIVFDLDQYGTPFIKHTVLMSNRRHTDPVIANNSPMIPEKSFTRFVGALVPSKPHNADVIFRSK